MRLFKARIIFLIWLIPSLLIAQEKRIALIIGNNAYEQATSLQNPVNDAKAMAGNLQKLGFEVLLYSNLGQKELKQSIDLFGEKLKNYNVGLFYYSGHGIQVNGSNYLIPIDANLSSESDAEYDCVDIGRVLSKMEDSGSKANIIILDACRNNPFEKSWTRSITKTGLAFMDAPTGSLIAYSTSPGSTASDGNSENGLYTSFLLNSMVNPDINILQVFQEVRKNVRESSNGRQIPWESTSLESDFYFNQTGTVIENEEHQTEKKVKSPYKREVNQVLNKIKADTALIWSESTGASLLEADNLSEEKIEKELTLYFESLMNKTPQGITSSEMKRESVNLMIEDVKGLVLRKVFENDNDFRVIRYTSKNELRTNLDQKKNRILSLIENALEAENSYRIADALKYYYWAYSLTLVHPAVIQSAITGTDYAGNFLETHIPELIHSISFAASDSSYNNGRKSYFVRFYRNEKPLQNLNFRYWNGVSWSETVYANSGNANIEIYSSYSLKDVKINIEYANFLESNFDGYLSKSLQLTYNNKFNNERSLTFLSNKSESISVSDKDYHELVDKIVLNLKNRNPRRDTSLFTEEGYDVYRKLLVYGNASILAIENNNKAYSLNAKTYIRSIPCTFSFQNNSVKFSENICIELDDHGKVDNITFALSENAVRDIMNQERWPMTSRLQIIHFLENYKTAYALKRSDYIEKIFSDNALIIVGQKVELTEQPDAARYKLAGDYEFTKLTKEQYLYRLKNVFSRNEFINIRFEDNIVKKRDNQSEVYGINIRQNYFSSHYADQGYLFLMIDMKDSSKPMIYVRSWQPLETFNGHKISLSDFTY